VLASRSASAIDPGPGPGPEPPENAPPTIVDFTATQGILEWTFDGRVLDENPQNMVIEFGGLLAGRTATVSEIDGYFYLMIDIENTGQVTAQTTDDNGLSSNVAVCSVE
jgi:hypothetical protein